MDTEFLYILRRIATALEKIADSLNSNEHTIVPTSTELPDNNISENNEQNVFNPEEIEIGVLLEHLKQADISVKTYPKREEEKEELNNLAKFMGSRFQNIKRIYSIIKSSLNTQRDIHLNLKNAPQKEIADSCQFCTLLHNIAFLSNYRYERSPKFQIYATANTIPQAINFLTGHWLEIYVKVVVLERIYALNRPVQYTYLINPQIILPNGNDFELDLLFLIDNELYWIEAKTGNYQNYIHKYSQVADIIGIEQSHALLLLTEPPSKESISIMSCSFEMNIVGINEFESAINELIK